MTELALSADGVWKRFMRRGDGRPSVRALLASPVRVLRDGEPFWALRGVGFSLRRGEAVGVIGANGSGKSTLLRLAAGVGRPTRGTIVRAGSVGALLTLGESFDPLLTGRENALTAAILEGNTRREALRKLDEIVAFSELEEHIDDPLRTYSSGMIVRLAFAAAVNAAPDVVLIDEVLAVGDLRFQRKCLERVDELRAQGTAVLFASHDESTVRQWCGRALWLDRGEVRAAGDPDDVYAAYKDELRVETERRERLEPAHPGPGLELGRNRFGTLEVEIAEVRVEPAAAVAAGEIGVEIELDARTPVEDPIVVVSAHREPDGAKVLDVNTRADGVALGTVSGRTRVRLALDRLDAAPGSYRLAVGVFERDWRYAYDYHAPTYALELLGGQNGAAGTFGPPRRWRAA